MQVFINNNAVIKAKTNYYPQTLLKECKYEQEKIKMKNLIDDDLEKSLSDEPDSQSDNDKGNVSVKNNLLANNEAKKVF